MTGTFTFVGIDRDSDMLITLMLILNMWDEFDFYMIQHHIVVDIRIVMDVFSINTFSFSLDEWFHCYDIGVI